MPLQRKQCIADADYMRCMPRIREPPKMPFRTLHTARAFTPNVGYGIHPPKQRCLIIMGIQSQQGEVSVI
jgi:hypothetical protein